MDVSAARADAGESPECVGDPVTDDRVVVCGACALGVRGQYVDLAPRFQPPHGETDGTYGKLDDIRYRQVRRVVNSWEPAFEGLEGVTLDRSSP